MRRLLMPVILGAFFAPLHACKSTGGNSKVAAAGSSSSSHILSGAITTGQIAAHDNFLKAQGKLPAGDYNVVLSDPGKPDPFITGTSHNVGFETECANLYKVQQTNSDPLGLQKKYAEILGFKECRAAPKYTGTLIRTCHMAFNCTEPMIQPIGSSRTRYITLILDSDYQKGGDGVWPCGDAYDSITTVDGKSATEALGESGDSVTTFTGKTQNGSPVSGCRFRLDL